MTEIAKAPLTQTFKKTPGFPSEERFLKGPVAVIECEQEIPCNPCEISCPHSAITVGEPITKLPFLDGNKCTGCGMCMAGCPGQAIFLINMVYTDESALAAFPYEYLPLPKTDQSVDVVDRNGEVIGQGVVRNVSSSKAFNKTNIIFVEVDKKIGKEVRSIVRQQNVE